MVGDTVEKEVFIEPKGIFFERVVRQDPENPDSPLIGLGRFEAELWVLSWLGIDFTGFKKSELVAARFFFVAFFPFFLLVVISLLTKPVEKSRLDYFFGKIFTPIQETKDEDDRAVTHTANHPESVSAKKLFPGSNWEIAKPDRMDWLGFGGSWCVVSLVILLLWLMVTIQ